MLFAPAMPLANIEAILEAVHIGLVETLHVELHFALDIIDAIVESLTAAIGVQAALVTYVQPTGEHL